MRIERRDLCRWVCQVVLGGGLLLGAFPAAAQQPVEPTETQADLNEQGVQAVNSGNYEAAIELFQASLRLGELNITWLNLGRSLAKAGRCQEASEAYDQVGRSPRVAEPSAEVINEAAEQFRVELKEQCPAVIEVVCADPRTTIEVGAQAPVTCPEAPLSLSPGQHVLIARLGEGVERQSVEVQGMDRRRVEFTLTLPGDEPGVQPGGPGGAEVAGWVSLGAGGLVLGAALLIDVAILQPDIDELRQLRTVQDRQGDFNALKEDISSLQDVNIGLLATGSVLAVVGGVLLLWPDDEASPDASALWPWWSEHGAGVGWGGRW